MKKRIVKIGQYRCLGPTITEGKIKFLQKILNEDRHLYNFKKLCKVLNSETRFYILRLLHVEKELCVCDLADILRMTISAVSHQLRVLKQAGLVKTRRDSQTIYYSLIIPSKKMIEEVLEKTEQSKQSPAHCCA